MKVQMWRLRLHQMLKHMMLDLWLHLWLLRGGVFLDQILGTCFWKTHSTFTNFYLKDVAWKSTEGSGFSLGPVVSAQHIVQC